MSDLIDREDVIKSLQSMMQDCFPEAEEELDAVVITVREIPSAEPEWTPVSECLPSEDLDRVLVTIERPNGGKRVRSGHYFKEYFMMDNGDTWKVTDKEVLAWMPIPEPWENNNE